jgi:hypothetical protein
MSIKIKLTALVGMSLALLVTAACKGGGGEKANQVAKDACNQVQRICKDGSPASKDLHSCYQKCPEDTFTVTNVNTVTNTVTNTSTVTATQTATN